MATNIDAVLGVNGISPSFLLVGNCDVIVSGLTAGAVKLQYRLSPTVALPAPAWTDFPDGSFSANVYQTIFISDHGVIFRLVGVANNAGVYVRMAKFMND